MERGLVTFVEGEVAWVQLEQSDACNGCGAKVVCRSDGAGSRALAAQNPLGAQKGQWVYVAERGHITLKLASMQFGLPLLALLLGAGLAAWINPALPLPPEAVQGFSGLALMLASGWVTFKWAQKVAASGPVFEVTELL